MEPLTEALRLTACNGSTHGQVFRVEPRSKWSKVNPKPPSLRSIIHTHHSPRNTISLSFSSYWIQSTQWSLDTSLTKLLGRFGSQCTWEQLEPLLDAMRSLAKKYDVTVSARPLGGARNEKQATEVGDKDLRQRLRSRRNSSRRRRGGRGRRVCGVIVDGCVVVAGGEC
jgi:hypothetical protein